MISRGFDLGIDRDQTSNDRNRGLGFAVVFVGVAPGYRRLTRLRTTTVILLSSEACTLIAPCVSIIFRLAPGGKSAQVVVEVVAPPKMWEKSLSSKLNWSCNPDQFTRSSWVAIRPKTTIITTRNDSTRADSRKSVCPRAVPLVLDQFDHAPKISSTGQ
jgi:hypothetical protein